MGPNPWKAAAWSTLGVVLVVGLWLGIASSVWGLRVATAGIYGRGEARIQIQSAAFRIQAYQSFFDQCASIQGLEGKIDELTTQLALVKPGTRTYDYTLTSLTGAKGLRREAIARYNQDALKDWTEGQFRDNDLPYHLTNNQYPEGGNTRCAVK